MRAETFSEHRRTRGRVSSCGDKLNFNFPAQSCIQHPEMKHVTPRVGRLQAPAHPDCRRGSSPPQGPRRTCTPPRVMLCTARRCPRAG